MDGGVRATVLVNKKELGKLLDVSPPTLDKMIDENEDFPIETRGSNGTEYEFDPVKVKSWLEARRAASIAAHKTRMAALGSLSLDDNRDTEQTPAEMLALARYEEMRRRLAREAGHLVPIASLRVELSDVIKDLAARLDALPDQLARKHGFDLATADEIRAEIENMRDEFVTGLETLMTGEKTDAQRAA